MALLLLAVPGAAILYPILRPKKEMLSGVQGATVLEHLREQRRVLYARLRSLSLERSLGNLTEEDYQSLRQPYLQEAAKVLQQLEALPKSPAAPEQDLESEILELRKSLKGETWGH